MWEKKTDLSPGNLKWGRNQDEVGINVVNRWNWGEDQIRIKVNPHKGEGEIRIDVKLR